MAMWSFPPIPSYPGTVQINQDPNLRFNPRYDAATGFSFGTVQNPYLNFLFDDVNRMQTGIFNTFGGPGFGYLPPPGQQNLFGMNGPMVY